MYRLQTMTSATSDRANVNLGVYNGPLTQLAHERRCTYCTLCGSSARACHEGHDFSNN